ncbi:glucose 1-dehydrogenase [Pseudonocardia sp. KRD-184]|uniref:Glucose 1-dehydrogenase n=1 Tax=Pseudonocardia oceani TaxID=2792013 RepID=A0ABS6UGB7_9PSEU|nr:glucose 1-dehydrogenase [Pseudonocardia oceani]MBW0100482.1 glucose 1-dehydrogenase [Pseudonocardia oceani]MBW0113272.1 glucose 1-dehydrogenase [Pseudonocardia oceani]MBW0125964.1 glucose 1-dehydrogenase [Pseudonocardia oceani]MBW0131273.1 glucose 1-dehydrogenase [Pseudonocardia oceani]
MQALTVIPGTAGSVELTDAPEPPDGDGAVLVEGLAVGVCGTDREIVAGEYGEAPPAAQRLVIGHESLGRVLEAPDGAGLEPGDLAVGIVRRPDPVPCANCAAGEWDMCRNGRFTERGIKGRHGYASERYRLEPEFAVRLDPGLDRVGVLMEPTSVVAKAWEHLERIGHRAAWAPRKVLVTGAGPIGLLAALLGVQRGWDVRVLDRVRTGVKPQLVADLGATYHTDLSDVDSDSDVIIECTGAAPLVADVMARNAHNAVVCLTGVSSRGRPLEVDVGGLNRDIVLQNDVVFGSVNANRRHYEQAAVALSRADRGWLERLVTRRVPIGDFADALDRRDGDVKVVLDIAR